MFTIFSTENLVWCEEFRLGYRPGEVFFTTDGVIRGKKILVNAKNELSFWIIKEQHKLKSSEKMAATSTVSLLVTNSIPKFSRQLSQPREYVNGYSPPKFGMKRLRAGLSQVEPDLNEDPKDRWATNGIDEEDYVYGKYDGHHTYYESDDRGSFWGAIAEDYAAIGPPTGFQGLISWFFLPAIAAGMYFNVQGEYLYIGAALFTVVFCIIEMDKPSEPHNFEPQIYNMERGARDKLISDYNTMDIWDFNEKYGELWDFTVKKDITKR